jgi:hypothetical protein
MAIDKSLFQIQNEYLEAINELEEYIAETGDDTIPEYLQERLFINKNEAFDKINDYYKAIRMIDGQVETLDLEIKRLNHLKNSRVKTIARLRELVGYAVKMYGTVKKGNKSPSIQSDMVKASFIFTDKPVIDEERLEPKWKKFDVTATFDDKTLRLFWTALQAYVPQLGEEAERYNSIFQLLEETPTPDTHKIKQAIKEGETPDGVEVDVEAGYVRFT